MLFSPILMIIILIFKGSKFYKYDNKKLKIAGGYPKSIKSNWKGVPDNLDAIYVDNKTKTTFFVKGKYFYKYNDKNKRVEMVTLKY